MRSKTQKRIIRQIKIFWFSTTFLAITLLIFAVWQMNAYIHSSSQLSDAKKRVANLSSQNDSLQLQVSQLNSLDNFNKYAESLKNNFEKVDISSIHFVSVPSSHLAEK